MAGKREWPTKGRSKRDFCDDGTGVYLECSSGHTNLHVTKSQRTTGTHKGVHVKFMTSE